MLFRGSYLSNVSEVGCTEFAALGVRSVLDLRSLGEQSNLPATCVTDQARVISAPLPIPYNVSPEEYLADLYTEASIRTAFSVLSDESAYPVYFHCYYGKDRTGVLAAVILLGLGASRKTVQAEYALTGEAGLSYFPESINAVLDEIDRIGGIFAYFERMGVLPNQIEAMKKILTAPN
jgi:protein-tyrosine phosphatase